MPDVWLRYIRLAEDTARARIAGAPLPDASIDLLLTPWTGVTPGKIAHCLRKALSDQHHIARIAQSTSRVVARLDFLSLVRIVVPMTGWWQGLYSSLAGFQQAYTLLQRSLLENEELSKALSLFGSDVEFFRFAALVGFADRMMNAATRDDLTKLAILARRLGGAASDDEEEDAVNADGPQNSGLKDLHVPDIAVLIDGYDHAVGGNPIAFFSQTIIREPSAPSAAMPRIFLINVNRTATQSLFDSRKTIKADAACNVFDLNAGGLAFAVIDGGIDARHIAFLRRNDEEFKPADWTQPVIEPEKMQRWSRVLASYDFTILRDIINVATSKDPNSASDINRARVTQLFNDNTNNETAFEHLRIRSENARDLDWEIAEPLIRITHDAGYLPPGTDHGTHVAGILAGDLPAPVDFNLPLIGVCRDLSLYDLRVFDQRGHGDEFAILCAIEFVGWLNRDRSNPVVHGANLSLALQHDVDSFACGQTPICEACNHLVGSGTVVVAAAGNTGFEGGGAEKQSFGNGYRAISITDPGNASAVITVGSTHRRDPHLYGVSYFSGRGPTGDGRHKPDLLAPGEKITSTIRAGLTQRMDGTSMAAPHVSGAAALLMARYPELIGRPLRIKEILMQTATDLDRDRDFQGAGLLDVLRALQSV